MQHIIYIITIFLFFTLLTLQSQDIQNSGFENWSDQLYFENPDQFTTSNYLSYFATGEANATKTGDAQSGSWAIHLESIATPDGPLFGAVFIGDPDLEQLSGGIPFTVRPDAVSGYAKFDIQPNDTAYFAVVFKKFGAPIGYCIKRFYGTQGSYQSFTEPVEWLIPIISPDTMLTGMISSTFDNVPIPGSTITFDNVSFDGVSAQFPNGDFENWSQLEAEEPDNWTSSNIFSLSAGTISVTKSDDSFEGDFSVRIENQAIVSGDTLGFVTNGGLGEEGPMSGMPVVDIPDILSGYYKYTPVGSDTAIAGLTLYKYNTTTGQPEILDEIYQYLPATSSWTYFEVPVDYYVLPEPDTVNIMFAAGNFDEENSSASQGSVLWVDALDITYKPNLVAVGENRVDDSWRAYPNPVSKTLFFDIKEMLTGGVSLEITNLTGETVLQGKMSKSGATHFDVDHLSAGIFFYTLKIGNDKRYSGKFIKQ